MHHNLVFKIRKQQQELLKQLTDKKLARIRPSRLVKALNSNPSFTFKEAFVNYIRSLLAMLRHNVFRRKPICCSFQLLPAKLSEVRKRIFLPIL